MKRAIRLTESDLHDIIIEAINEVKHDYGLSKGRKEPDYSSDTYTQKTKVQNSVPNEIEYSAQKIEKYLAQNLDSPYGWKPYYQVKIDANSDEFGDKSRISILFRPQYPGDLIAIAKALETINKMPGHVHGVGIRIECKDGYLIAKMYGNPEAMPKNGRNTRTTFGRNTGDGQMPRQRDGSETHAMGPSWYPS